MSGGGNLGNAGCSGLPVEAIGLDVFQGNEEPRIMWSELTGFEWAAIRSFLPNKPRGIPRVNRTVLQQGQAMSACRDPIHKLAANYLAFIKLASIRIWLRTNDFTS
jgi:transposase